MISTTSPLLGILHPARLGQEGAEVRGEEVLAVAEPDHQRRLAANGRRAGRGWSVVDHDEGEVPFEPRVDGAHSLDEVAVVDRLEQVRDHLGVGLRARRRGPPPRARPSARGSSRRSRSARSRARARRSRSADGRCPRSRRRALPSACGRARSWRASRSGPRRSFRLARLPTARTYSRPSSSRSAIPAES